MVALVNEQEVGTLNVGTRPVGAWMEPFHFQLKSEGAAATVTNLDFTPHDGLFVLGDIETPFLIGRDETVDLDISTNGVEAGVIERQFVAIYQEGGRTAAVWPVIAEFYAPEIPDVVEMARPHDEITFPYVETVTGMHNDYTLPFPDIEEGNDAVFELVIDADAVLNASVSNGDNGKVALYTEDFNGEGGPMANNNYTGPTPTTSENTEYTAGPIIENLPVTPGTYYLVASSTSDPFTVEINTEPMPCPEQAYGPTPADDIDGLEPASVTLQWHLPDFATEYRLVFGTTYYPDPEHPQSVLVDWTSDLAESYTVTDLWNNTNEVCVRMVYPGTAELPDNNYYYAMSCPECVEPALVCESDITIHGEALTATDQSKIWWGEQPVPGNEWLSYLSIDDEFPVEGTLGAQGMPFYWGCMYPASMIVEQGFTSGVIDQIWFLDVGDPELTGNCEVHIYLGGDNAPQTEITSQTYYIDGEQGLKPIQLNQPVAIDGTQNLWVMFYTDGSIDAPAPMTTYLGDPNTMWMGVQDMWVPLSSFGYTYSFIQFVHVSNGGKGEFLTMDDGTATNFTNGTTREANLMVKPVSMSSSNATSLRDDNGAPVKYNVYRSTDNINYTLIGEVPYVEGQTYYEYIDSPTTSNDYYYQVRTVYEDGCESVPALNADDLAQNYVLISVSVGLNEQSDEVALFPNPTKGNVTVQASGMNHITVVSVLGQVVFDTEVNTDEYTLNMAQFNAGMYMVRVNTASGMTVKCVMVMQ